MNLLAISNTLLKDVCAANLASVNSSLSIRQSSFQTITRNSFGPSCLAASSSSSSLFVELENCTSHKCISSSDKGRIAALTDLTDVNLSSCAFDGKTDSQYPRSNADSFKNLCKWNGSMIDLLNCSGAIKDTTIANSSKGGPSISGGNNSIQFGLFSGNNPNAAGYPSIRNNFIFSHNALLNIVNLKGGDDVLQNISMWIAGDDCTLAGLASESLYKFINIELTSIKF
ncbi:uncharacterized protein MONOS_15636 [Monocercomonoides exilis]|uniref:uncharacterized protein n=1 Tax=Monocercomonoides exilis TaxID=2049356 RepID=UPI0035599218|nr:hypothetical protein MONOS_15636 [Monocercomonoides exilis]|eukprot:MONOS_15636.1-p1 / transcript=MONOS_15636.1 / gene=MONOS_15636 / organism=Monocercomonoides_exilis_PA203 / gene_product=unspecified product / transcript_product=unspecified product / location=Mono_scaffold01294:2967-3650(-) / protein_length=228 / sequence_SO=supercontig / SO=protein_coding / is_pseudo=false